MNRVKVFFIQDTLMSAGAERSHLEIMGRFSPKTEASMVYFYPKHDLKQAYEKAGIQLHFLGLTGKYDWIKGIYRLVKLIRKEKPQVMVACLARSTQMARAASLITGVPVVGTLVNDSYGDTRLKELTGNGYWKFRFFWWLDRVGSGIHIHWISNARCLADSHLKTLGLKREKISVIHRGRSISDHPWKFSSADATKPMKFISYGRLLERKGFGELIRAFALLREEFPDIQLTIYGEGDERHKLEELISELQVNAFVTLPGASLEVEKHLLEADCFVFPSWYEGFSGALVEAMMAGIPIIASDIPMNLEALVPDEHGLTFRVKDVDDLKEKMRYALVNRGIMAEKGMKAREEAITRFEIGKIAAEYEALLHKILNVPVVTRQKENIPVHKLRLGILVDSYFLPAWAWEMLRVIDQEGYGKIELIIQNTTPKTSGGSSPLFYRTYRWLDRKLFAVPQDAFVRKDIRQLPFWPVQEMKVKPLQTQHVDRFENHDIEKLKSYNLDVIIRLGFRILKGEVLKVPAYGIWSFHHGDNRVNRGGPPCFWEVMLPTEETGSLLQVLTEKLDDGVVLYRSWSRTNPLSVNRNANRVFWKSIYFVPRELKRLSVQGEEEWRASLVMKQDPIGLHHPPLFRPPRNGQMFGVFLRFLWRNGWRKFNETTRREFWQLYAGKRNNGLLPDNGSLRPIPSPRGTYYADPFVWERDGVTAMFFESYEYKTRKASIEVMTWNGQEWGNTQPVLKEPIHLSYPFIFEDQGVLYMVPESAEASEVVLYRCTEFPYRWRRDRVLMENVKGYDPTIVVKDSKYWLFMNEQAHPVASAFDELFLYYADALNGPWTPHPQNPIVSDVKSARPAGRIFQHEGTWYRPAQDSAKHYGHRIRLQKILKWSEKEYEEITGEIIEASWDKNLMGTHTYNFNKDWVVVDGYRR